MPDGEQGRSWTLEGDDESGRAGHITVHGEPLEPGERVRVYEHPTDGEGEPLRKALATAYRHGLRLAEGAWDAEGTRIVGQNIARHAADALGYGKDAPPAESDRTLYEWEPCVDCHGEPFSQPLPDGSQGCAACMNRGGQYLPVPARARSDVDAVLRGLTFRRERSRPVFRNKHTGTEVVVLDLAVDDRGGFQGGCRQFTVVTDEAGPPGYKTRGPYSLDSFVQHWEPTGEHVPVDSDRIRERLHGD
jgi:hypothetical protein